MTIFDEVERLARIERRLNAARWCLVTFAAVFSVASLNHGDELRAIWWMLAALLSQGTVR